jgi:hypothetical protein
MALMALHHGRETSDLEPSLLVLSSRPRRHIVTKIMTNGPFEDSERWLVPLRQNDRGE